MNPLTSLERLTQAMERAHLLEDARQDQAAERGEVSPAKEAFTITISREAGTDGGAVARTVGERLGWPVYDRELLDLVAGQLGVQASLLKDMDERSRSWLLECLDALSSAPTVGQLTYVHRLVQVLQSLASRGQCVIVGRGAAQVLPAATTLRVRLVAPLASRVEAMQRRFGCSREEATRRAQATDEERSRFVREQLQKDPSDPRGYDLVLNPCRLGTEGCATLIVEALAHLRTRVAATCPTVSR